MILNREELRQKLAILGKAYASKTPQPALQFVKFDNDTLTLSNGSTIIINKYYTGIQALIPFKQLNDICNKLTANELDLTIVDNQAVIKAGRSRFALNLGDLKEFPNFNILKDMEGLKIDCSQFVNVIGDVNYACSKDEKRPILTGVNFNKVITATDSFKLSQYNKDLGLRCTINTNDINNLISILKDEVSVLVRNNNNVACFEFGDTIYQCRLLDGNYPDTSRLISNNHIYTIKIDRTKLIEAVDRVNIFNEEYSTIIIDANNGILKLTATANQVGDACELLECDNNENIKFACNGEFLVQALSKFKRDVIELNLLNAMKPITIKEDDLVALVLPIKVSD